MVQVKHHQCKLQVMATANASEIFVLIDGQKHTPHYQRNLQRVPIILGISRCRMQQRHNSLPDLALVLPAHHRALHLHYGVFSLPSRHLMCTHSNEHIMQLVLCGGVLLWCAICVRAGQGLDRIHIVCPYASSNDCCIMHLPGTLKRAIPQ